MRNRPPVEHLAIGQLRTIQIPNKSVVQGQDSPTLKLCYYLSPWLGVFQWKTLLVEKTVIVEVGESQPRFLPETKFLVLESSPWPDAADTILPSHAWSHVPSSSRNSDRVLSKRLRIQSTFPALPHCPILRHPAKRIASRLFLSRNVRKYFFVARSIISCWWVT